MLELEHWCLPASGKLWEGLKMYLLSENIHLPAAKFNMCIQAVLR